MSEMKIKVGYPTQEDLEADNLFVRIEGADGVSHHYLPEGIIFEPKSLKEFMDKALAERERDIAKGENK